MNTGKTSNGNAIRKYSEMEGESGIALLMSLGVMSLLIVLSLSFALTTMNSMKSVELSQDIVKARLFDESGFQKVYGLLSSNFADPNETVNLFPATKPDQLQYVGPKSTPGRFDSGNFNSSDWAGRAYWFSVGLDSNGNADTEGFWEALEVDYAGKDFVPNSGLGASVLTDGDPENQIGWIHILDSGQDYPNNDTPIVARVAYVIVDESGKVDPWEIVDTDTREENELRVGRELGEINMLDAIPNVPENIARSFGNSSESVYEGLASDTRKWTSLFNIYKTFDLSDTTLLNQVENVDEIQKNLFPFSYDIEAFFDGVNDKHRFNMGANTDSPLWWDFLPGNKIDTILQPASDFSADNTGGIPWLSIPYNDPAFDNSPVETQVAQIAANIIDYCDSDSYATYNFTDAAIPIFCGNEKVPYINEVRFQASTAANPGATTLNLSADIELINIYDIDWDPDIDLVIDIDILDGAATLFSNVLFTHTITAQLPQESYFTQLNIDATGVFNVTAPIANFQIQINSIFISDPGTAGPDNVWDFAFDTPFLIPDTTILINAAQSISIEVNDPRNNQNTDSWTGDKDGDSTIDNAPTWGNAGTMGTRNINFFYDETAVIADQDTELLDPPGIQNRQPWTISTVFIRNAPMQSLWEIGAIHRGAAWQTINLSDYNDLFIQQVATDGLGNYQPAGVVKGGDANILSQIKLSSDTEVYGRININTYNPDVIKALFTNLVVGENYEHTLLHPNPPSNNILGESLGTNSGTPETLKDNALSVNGTTGGEPYRFRAQIATIPGIADNTVITLMDNDRAKEEVIGKIAGLLTTRQNYFSAIITSQIIKDMITNYKGGTRGVFDVGIDEILAEQRLSAILYRDAINNEFEVVRYEYLDE